MCSNVSLVSETEKITTRKDRNLTSHTYQLGKKVGVCGGRGGGATCTACTFISIFYQFNKDINM